MTHQPELVDRQLRRGFAIFHTHHTHHTHYSQLVALLRSLPAMKHATFTLALLLTACFSTLYGQDDLQELYDIAAEFVFLRIQYDSYYARGH